MVLAPTDHSLGEELRLSTSMEKKDHIELIGYPFTGNHNGGLSAFQVHCSSSNKVARNNDLSNAQMRTTNSHFGACKAHIWAWSIDTMKLPSFAMTGQISLEDITGALKIAGRKCNLHTSIGYRRKV